jgi:adenylate cyclase
MSGKQRTLAIAFADVRGSTGLYEAFGDERGRAMTAAAVNGFCKAVQAQGGRVVKTMGDGAMVTLPSAEAAVLAAIATQEFQRGKRVSVGIGLQWGSVLEEENDVFGDAVNVAARLCGLAKAGEILTTADTVEAFPPLLRSATRFLDTIAVRGRREPVKVHQVVWDSGGDSTMTVVATKHGGGFMKRLRTLTLSFGGQDVRFDATSAAIKLGRLGTDVVVPDTLASRQHATVENWSGKFLLTDQSTNGTYVVFDHGGQTVLKRESGELTDSGYIGLGRPPTPENPHRLRFVVDPGDEG